MIAELPETKPGGGVRPAPARTASGSTTGPDWSCWPASTQAGRATLMLADGVPVKVVSERLGHANDTITLTVYDSSHTAEYTTSGPLKGGNIVVHH